MFELMQANGWKLDDSKRAKLQFNHESITSIENNIQLVEANEEEETKRFAGEVTSQIPVLNKNISDLRVELDDFKIKDLNSSPESALALLMDSDEKLNALKQNAEKLAEYEASLGMPVSEFEVLEDVVADLKLKLELWQGVKDWDVLTATWEATPLKDVDAGSLEKKVSQYSRTAFKATKQLTQNPVAPALKEKVDLWTPVLPLVVDLRNESLKERHWTQIHDVIGFELKGNDSFTLVHADPAANQTFLKYAYEYSH